MRAELARDGHVTVRGVVPADEVAAMLDLVTTVMPAEAYPPVAGIVHEVVGLARFVEGLVAIVRDTRFGALVAEALGASRVQLLQDSLLYKPAGEGGAVELHQDRTYIGYLQPPRVATLRLALLPEDADNGCMHVVDGSHAWGAVGDDRSLVAASVASLVPHLTPQQREQIANARALALAPGDVSIHHCLTLHGSAPNTSTRPRRTIVMRMFDSECRLDPARLPPGAAEHFPVDDAGRLATSAFPVVFGRDR